MALCLATVLHAQTGPMDFARGIEVRTGEAGAIFRVTLPRDVYATITQPNLDDVRVFNAAGTPVPITIRRVLPPRAASEEPESVPHFPMYTRESDRGAASAQVKVDQQGAVLEVTGRRDERQTLSWYLVDVSRVQTPIASLSLDWRAREDASFLGHVDVQGSDNLNAWRTVAASVGIAQIRHGAYTITQREIELSGARARYLRLTWPRDLQGVSLTGVQVRRQGSAPASEPHWELLTPAPVPDSAGRASYDAGAQLPVERIDLEFVDATDAAYVTVRSGADPGETFQTRHAGLFYTLTESDTRLNSPPARIPQTHDRYWQIETTRDGGWGGRLPRLRLGWYPQELLFIAQGEGPYTLAYGSGRVGPNDAPIDAVLANLKEEDRARIRDAILGDPRELAGSPVLTPPGSWRREILWGVLIGAVLVLGVLATRLLATSNTTRR